MRRSLRLALLSLGLLGCVEYIELDPDAGGGPGDADADRDAAPEADLAEDADPVEDADLDRDDEAPAGEADLEAPAGELVIEPAEATLVTHYPGAPASLSFRALVRREGQEPLDATSLATWSLEGDLLASLSGAGVLTATNRAGGEVEVRAAYAGREASASLSIFLVAELLASDDGELPALPAEAFPADAPTIGSGPALPALVYPADETMLPPNFFLILFQWTAPSEADLFRLVFRGDRSRVTVYTTRDRWLALEDEWAMVARSNAGGQVSVELAACDLDAEPLIAEAPARTLLFSEGDLSETVYYWSTSAQGVMRSSLRRPVPERFYSDPATDDRCVGCHTLSRDGRQLALGYDGERLRSLSVPERDLIIADDRWGLGWASFSPEGSRLAVADRGKLRLLDAATGDPVGADEGQVPLPLGLKATMPDWSPLGDSLALTLAEKLDNQNVEKGVVARLSFAGDRFGEPEVLVEPWGELDNCFAPAYSPDGAYIAFACAHGKSKDQRRTRLYLAPAEGGPPLELTRLNERVGPEDGVIELGNTLPTWAPSTGGDPFWLVFSSLRDYGLVLQGEARDQLWVAAVDPSLAEVGLDPGFAAFWLPLQQLTERNHRAFFTSEPGEECSTGPEVCDGVDNDCDGSTDEDCVVCSPAEICGDLLDNDCDGVPDEGCQCASMESCDNGIDDDCDGLVDFEDEDCDRY